MDIGTTCPACGAQLAIAQTTKHVQCTYCGNEFDVNLEGVNPELSVASSSREMPDAPPPPEPEEAAFVMPPPAPTPAQSEFVTPPPVTSGKKPAFSIPGLPASAKRPIWAIIAIVVAAVLCSIFACMALVFVITRAI